MKIAVPTSVSEISNFQFPTWWFRVSSFCTSIWLIIHQNSLPLSLKSQFHKIWITTNNNTSQFRSTTIQKETKSTSIFLTALKMARMRIPFTSLSLSLLFALSILNLAHCKTLKRDGNDTLFQSFYDSVYGVTVFAFLFDGSKSLMGFHFLFVCS